ncbi:hypothetical protein EB796_021651 [Bugula neritina]|uniref:Molybdopterin synthase sulfur carrier subunit n=1 Tax=Bugula neritina TaxID=10212 RepID=A0A7J7J3R8_BUGNE|nr:hypothetical protein EB796_021651 [Bugula neritina]
MSSTTTPTNTKSNSSSDLIKIKVLLFAKARDLVGEDSVYISLPRKIEYQELVNSIFQQLSSLEAIKKTVVLALNEEYIKESEPVSIKEGDTIAIITPISSG